MLCLVWVLVSKADGLEWQTFDEQERKLCKNVFAQSYHLVEKLQHQESMTFS